MALNVWTAEWLKRILARRGPVGHERNRSRNYGTALLRTPQSASYRDVETDIQPQDIKAQ